MRCLTREIVYLFILSGLVFTGCQNRKSSETIADSYSGSKSCIHCHAHFYDLWSKSFHGMAMQPITRNLLKVDSLPPSGDFSLEGKVYRMAIRDTSLVMLEKNGDLVNDYQIDWALGGKNVFYFLTPMNQGKLQTIPLAYDVKKKIWYNNPQSAVRHFPEGEPDQALPWKDRMYTFNTACYSCHVSQLSTNYNLATDSYRTTWKESGINCETCHGPSAAHVKLFEGLKDSVIPADLKIIDTRKFTPEQQNSSCAPCHAKMRPITSSYIPGESFYDHYDLITLEHADFYPDGRDLGENYTMTSWEMNPCKLKSNLNCITCHTSSGRTRYTGNQSNQLCMPCHKDKVEKVTLHSQHPAGSPGAICINCHMPKTRFGNMVRSDHSFRPPMPEATIRFNSPNACNLCHQDKTPEWANRIVKKRTRSDYQDETLYWGELMQEAKKGDWKNLDKILLIVSNDNYGEVVTNSFVRLLARCNDDRKWDALLKAMDNSSPLVRSSAASSLTGNFSKEAGNALIRACSDKYRLVRIAAASTLSAFQPDQLPDADRDVIARATDEYKQSLLARPDDWSSYYNLAIYYENTGDIGKALESYETADRLYPESLLPLINSSVLYSYIGNPEKAEENLKKAIAIDPENEAANLNLGLLLVEQGDTSEAKKALARALEKNPKQAVAAYNLSILSADSSIEEAIRYATIAYQVGANQPKYGYTLAFYLNKAGNQDKAVSILTKILAENPGHLNSIYLLGGIYMKENKYEEARILYKHALALKDIPATDKAGIQELLQNIP